MPSSVRVVGLGGSMRVGSTSLTALQTALDGVATAAALPSLFWVRDLDLSMHSPEPAIPRRRAHSRITPVQATR